MSASQVPSHVRRNLRIGGLIAAVIAIAVVGIGLTARANNAKQLKQWTGEQAITTVSVITPARKASSKSLDLPGRFEAYASAPIYARVSGYLKNWKAEIGTPVKAGQLLGEIETPDLDQQIQQARAEVANAKASANLAEITTKRLKGLLETNSVSHQEVDQSISDYASKQALLLSAQANLDRLLATKVFTRLVAPFDGVVTQRNTDVGALINAGSGSGPALFVVSSLRKLRLYVEVPQSYISAIKVGDTASIIVPERGDKTYIAKVTAFSHAVNAATGTTLLQLSVNNSASELLPGGYAKVSFALPGGADTLSIPSSALIFNNAGLRVATLDVDDKVVLKDITIARDLGREIEVGVGLEAADRVVDNPPDGISTGEKVRVKQEQEAPQGDSAARENT